MPQHLQVGPDAPRERPLGDDGRWRGVLRHREFRWVWFGAMGSSLGTWMEGVGVQWLMAEQTASAVMLGILAAAQLGPMLLLGMPAGLLVDRVDRRAMLLATQAVMMTIAALLAAASAGGWATPGVLLALMLANGVAMAFNTPAWQTLAPRLVPRDELPRAIALLGAQFNVARVLGPAIAGIVMAQLGAVLLFTVNALSFVGVLLAVRATAPAPAERAPGSPSWIEVREVLTFVRDHRGVRQVMISLLVLSALAAPLQRMLPLFVSDVYGAEESTYGALLAALGVGAVLGAWALGRLPAWYPRHHIIPLSLALAGASIVAFSAAPGPGLGAVCAASSGFFSLWGLSSMRTSVQLLTPDAMRGRVLALFSMAMFGALPVGSVLAAVVGARLAAWCGGGAALAMQLGVGSFAALLTVAGVALLIWRTPEIDELAPGEPGYARRAGLWAGVSASGHRPSDDAAYSKR